MNTNEDILMKIISETKPDKPSGDFTSRLMQKIEKEPVCIETAEAKSVIGIKYIILLGLALVSAVVVLFFVDFSFLNSLFSNINFLKVPAFFNSIYEGIRQIFAGVELSSMSITIIIGVVGLILIERLLRKSFQINLLML